MSSAWPGGTTASASSTHPDLDNSALFVEYASSNAIDTNNASFWNDNTVGDFPDWLLLTIPEAVNLSGITILSNSDGYITDFSVSLLHGASINETVKSVTDATSVQNTISFDPVYQNVTAVRIDVSNATTAGENQTYTRISQLWPIYADDNGGTASSSSSSSSSSATAAATSAASTPISSSSSSSTASHSTDTSAIIGGVVGGVVGLAILIGIGTYLYLRRKRHLYERPHVANNSHGELPGEEVSAYNGSQPREFSARPDMGLYEVEATPVAQRPPGKFGTASEVGNSMARYG